MMRVNGRRWKRLLLWRRWFGHRPHVHGDGPVGLDHCLPDLRQDDLTIGTHEVVVALMDMRANDIDVKESLFDELLHTLYDCQLFTRDKAEQYNIPSTSYINSKGS